MVGKTMKENFKLMNWINTFVLGLIAVVFARGLYGVMWRSQGIIAIIAAIVGGWLIGHVLNIVWQKCRPRFLLIIGGLIGYVIVGYYGAQSLRTSPDAATYLSYIWLLFVMIGSIRLKEDWLSNRIQESSEKVRFLALPILLISLLSVVFVHIGYCLPNPDASIQLCPPRRLGVAIIGPTEVYFGEPAVFEIEANRHIESDDVIVLRFDGMKGNETIIPISTTKNTATFVFDYYSSENSDTRTYVISATVRDFRTIETAIGNQRVVVIKKP